VSGPDFIEEIKVGDPCPACRGSGKWEPLPRPTRRDILYKKLLRLVAPFRLKRPERSIAEIVLEKYGVNEVRLLSVEQVADLVAFMEREVQS